MELFVSEDAVSLIKKRGGVAAIDFVPPIGWGRTKYDVSVDMHLKGKNLAPYRVIRHGDVKIHVAPNLIGYAQSVQLEVRGSVRKKLSVDLHHEHGPGCNH